MNDYGNDNKSALTAKFDAQRIAFGPIMFQAARVMRNLGILRILHENRHSGLTVSGLTEKSGLGS